MEPRGVEEKEVRGRWRFQRRVERVLGQDPRWPRRALTGLCPGLPKSPYLRNTAEIYYRLRHIPSLTAFGSSGWSSPLPCVWDTSFSVEAECAQGRSMSTLLYKSGGGFFPEYSMPKDSILVSSGGSKPGGQVASAQAKLANSRDDAKI